MISYEDFAKLEIRVGKIVEAVDFPDARKPAYKLKIDFGKEIGQKSSSAQITDFYKKDELVGKLILGVTNFPQKQIGNFFSEVLTLGVVDENGGVVLVFPDKPVPLGSRLF